MIDVSRWQMPLIESFTDLRYATTRVMDLAKKKNQPVVIAKNNKPEAVILSVRTFEDLLSQMQMVQDQRDVMESEEIIKNTKANEWISVEELTEELLGKGYVRRYLRSAGGKKAKKVA